MAGDAPSNTGRITVDKLHGLNERQQHAQDDPGSFDIVKGCLPTNENTLTKANACGLTFSGLIGQEILSIFQTNDARGNMLLQTNLGLYLAAEWEALGQPAPTSNLTPISQNEEETMSRAVLIATVTAGTNGGTYTTGNTWQQAPLTTVLSQLNPDGSPASFVTLSGNQMTIAIGVYRIRGWSIMNSSQTNRKMAARLFNISASTPAWSGQGNAVSYAKIVPSSGDNVPIEFGGDLTIAGSPTVFEIQGLMQSAQTSTGFGVAGNVSGFTLPNELYRWIEILKTA